MPFCIKIKRLIGLLCLLISLDLNPADPNFAGYLFDQPTINENFPNELVREADKDATAIVDEKLYNLPPRVWMTFNGKGARNGPDDDDNGDWLHYAMGMAGIIGAKLSLSAQDMKQFIKHYGEGEIDERWEAWTELKDIADAYKPGGNEHKRYFDLYIKALFKQVIPLAEEIQTNYDKRPKTNLSKLDVIPGITKLDLKNQIDTISLYNPTTFVTTTVPSSRNWSKPKPILDNDVLLGKNEQKLNISENYFRHGFTILTGFLPPWNDIYKKYYNGTNPLNPFDPIDSWGYVTDPLPEIYKKACICPNGDVLVLGNDCQPYFYEKSTSKVYGYALKYRDGCIDIAVGKDKAAILYRNNDLKIKTYTDAKMNEWKIYNRGITPVSPWNGLRDTINSWGYAYHTHETYQQTVWDWRDTPALVTKYPSKYSINNVSTWETKTLTNDCKLVCLGFDDSIWLVSNDGKIIKKTDTTETEATGASNIVKLSAGISLAAAIDETGFLYLCDYAADDKSTTFNKTSLKVRDCSVSVDNGIALVDDKNSVYYLEQTFLKNLNSPDVANNSPINIKTIDTTPLSFDTAPSGIVSLSATGKTFFIEKNPKFNIVTFKASNGKYLRGHKNGDSIVENTQLMADLEAQSMTSVATDEAFNSITHGQWVLLKHPNWTPISKKYYIVERLSKKYIGKIGQTNQLGIVGEDQKIAFDLTQSAAETATVGTSADFDIFMKAVGSASKTNIDNIELSALESKFVMLAALCKVYVDSKPSTSTTEADHAVSKKVCDTFYGKGSTTDWPDGLALADRALAILTLLDQISTDREAIDATLSKSGLITLVNKITRTISERYSDNSDIKDLANQINKRFKVETKASTFSERFSDLKASLTQITNQATANTFFNKLEALVKDRIEAETTTFTELKQWIVQINNQPQELSYIKKLNEAGITQKINNLSLKMAEPISIAEAVDRISRFSSETGVLNTAQQTAFLLILSKLFETGPLSRLSISKNKVQTIQQAITKIKSLNPTMTIPSATQTTINGINFSDFKVGFIAKIRNLIMKTIPANVDETTYLWKQDSVEPSTPLDALNPTTYYTLSTIWEDFSCWKEWAPDLTNPANRIPLMVICNQIRDSININFSANQKYSAIKTEVDKMITELEAAASKKT